MYDAPVISRDEEKALLADWFDTVHWDQESQGVPELDPENDDEGRSIDLAAVDFDTLMAELRKRDPDNPF